MRAVSKAGRRVLDYLMGHTDRQGCLKLDNTEGAYMPLVVERVCDCHLWHLPATLWSFAHYGKQNGDAMRDPDVVLLKADNGEWYPVSFQNDYLGTYQEAVIFEDNGTVKGFQRKLQKDLAVFVSQWMQNIKSQQGLKV